MSKKYKSKGKIGLFDKQFATEQLSEMGNPLAAISKVIDFEFFRPVLEEKLLNTNKKNNAGAKPFDVVLMFKIMLIQRYYNLGDEQVEYQIIDRTSFKVFLGLETGDKVPDQKTIWAFRERLTEMGIVEDLFDKFSLYLKDKGLVFNEGKIIDASFTEVPRQRNNREKTSRSRKKTGTIYGMIPLTRRAIRILMHAGLRKMERTITDTRIISRLTGKASLLTLIWFPMHPYTILRYWKCCSRKKMKINHFMLTVLILASIRRK